LQSFACKGFFASVSLHLFLCKSLLGTTAPASLKIALPYGTWKLATAADGSGPIATVVVNAATIASGTVVIP